MKTARTERRTPGSHEHGAGALLLALVLALTLPLLAPSSARAQDATSHLDAARERIAEGQIDDAVPLLRRELRERPENDEARLLLARILSWQRRFDESLSEYRLLIAHRPGDAAVRAGYARVLAWSGRNEEAVREFRVAIAADSTNLETRVGYARALSWGGDLAGAAQEYDRVLAADPTMGEAWLGLASVARWRGAATASDRYLEKANQLGADDHALAEERDAVRTALRTTLGGGWTGSEERQYVTGPDFTLESSGPFTQVRGTAGRATGVVARASWLDLTETPASGGTPSYDVESEVYRLDLSFLRDYPWQLALGAEYRKLEQGTIPATYPLRDDDDFVGWTGRLWRFAGRLTPHASARREYVAVKDTLPNDSLVLDPGHVDAYEVGTSWQWSGRGTLDLSGSRGFYSDGNRRWTAGGGLAYRVKTSVPSLTLDGRVTYRDWDVTSTSYFTPQGSVRGAAGLAVRGWAERASLDYGFRYEFSGLGSTNFEDIWSHAWSGYLNATVADRLPLGLEASYSVDNNSYETWYLGFSAAARW